MRISDESYLGANDFGFAFNFMWNLYAKERWGRQRYLLFHYSNRCN
jgi:hypothetical protein